MESSNSPFCGIRNERLGKPAVKFPSALRGLGTFDVSEFFNFQARKSQDPISSRVDRAFMGTNFLDWPNSRFPRSRNLRTGRAEISYRRTYRSLRKNANVRTPKSAEYHESPDNCARNGSLDFKIDSCRKKDKSLLTSSKRK